MKFFILLSHTLTDAQRTQAREVWGADEFVSLPETLQSRWSAFDPDARELDLTDFMDFLRTHASKGDVAVISGDFGATFAMVNFARSIGVVPVYATTRRIVREVRENGILRKISEFEHRIFREYK